MTVAGDELAHLAAIPRHCPLNVRPTPTDPSDPPPRFQIALHSFCSDATNALVYRGSKVHTTELWSAYLTDPRLLQEGMAVSHALSWERFLSDLQIVDGGAAAATYSLVAKQLRVLGCPGWHEGVPKLDPTESGTLVVDVWAYCSDRGSDEVLLRKAGGAS